MFKADDWLEIGKIVSAQGLKGQLRVNPSSDFPERFTKNGPRWVTTKQGSQPREVNLLCGRPVPGKSIYIIQLEGINNRNDAEDLIGQTLLVPVNSRPKLKSNEFHVLDLIGLQVHLNENDLSIGEVKGLESAGNDLLEVELKTGKKILIPLVKEIVPEININQGWLKLTPPQGLLDL